MKIVMGELLRNKATNQLYVVYSINKVGILVVDLAVKENPTPLRVILLRDLKNWEEDKEIEEKKIKENDKYREDYDLAQAAYDLGKFLEE